ncbi:MAG: VTT domain-containing protein [Limnobacter sp.]|nr:VTT domain-containing protein [Limnobacter sp.]
MLAYTPKIGLFALLAVALTGLVLLYQEHLTIDNVLMWQMQMREWYVMSPVQFALLYFTLFTAVTALCLPGASLMMLAAGGCMGFTACCALSVGASATGALVTMLVARHAFRSHLEYKYRPTLDKINAGLNRSPISYLLSLRLAPVIPFVLFNILAGLTRLKSSTFFWTSLLGMLPGTVLYVHAGAQAGQATSIEDLVTFEMLLAVAALAIVPWGLKLLAKPWAEQQAR